jgi:hypothetical protein
MVRSWNFFEKWVVCQSGSSSHKGVRMTGVKIKEVLEVYRLRLEGMGVKPVDFNHVNFYPSLEIALGHCLGMIPKMVEFVDEGRIEKAFRWLGFIQGVLWAHGAYSLEDMKNHNRPAE